MHNSSAAEAIRYVIARFANCLDRKDWQALRACMTETVYTDYSDFRGTPADSQPADHYVASRREALQMLLTHHLGGNPEIEVVGDSANASLSMMIWRRNEAGQQRHSHCLYQFGLINSEANWRIAGVVQRVYWSEGDLVLPSELQHG